MAGAPRATLTASPLIFGLPRPAFVLTAALLGVGAVSTAYLLAVPFDTAAFGGLTVPIVLASGVADGFNPCAFALLVLVAVAALLWRRLVCAGWSGGRYPGERVGATRGRY